ncbi:MmgE/PrpD family protein [Thermodesulfobacteriota bacterium]
MHKRREASEILAQYTAKVRYEQIPSMVREATKKSILDTLGVTVAAGQLGLGHSLLVKLIKEGGGKKESTILSFGGKVPAWMAAMANGAMSRAMNFDDNHDESIAHPSGVTVPAALAVAERVGNVSGKDFITAVTLGNDISCRMGLSICRSVQGVDVEKWFMSSVHGVFGAAAACGKLLGFDAEKIQNTFGIALFESAGTAECFTASGSVSMMRGMVTGFTAKSAVLSALMTEKGITGVRESLDGKAGLHNVYFDGDYNRNALIRGLGKKFVSGDIAIKAWPTCRYTHSYIDNTLRLMRDHHIEHEAIKQIRIHVAGFVKTRCEPLEHQRRPENFNHAGHALPYLIALAATKRRIRLKDLLDDLENPQVLEMAQKVIPEYDERFDLQNRIGPSKVEVELKNGKSYSKQLRFAYGHPRNPLSWEDLIEKFRECISYSKKRLSKEKVDKFINELKHLEKLKDVRNLVQLIT